MKRNQNFDHNHSQKLLSFRYNIDTNRVEARFTDGSAVANRMPNCLRTSSTRYFTVGLTRRIECHRFFHGYHLDAIVTYFALRVNQARSRY